MPLIEIYQMLGAQGSVGVQKWIHPQNKHSFRGRWVMEAKRRKTEEFPAEGSRDPGAEDSMELSGDSGDDKSDLSDIHSNSDAEGLDDDVQWVLLSKDLWYFLSSQTHINIDDHFTHSHFHSPFFLKLETPSVLITTKI